uniref:Uncharacterized protein n=1 Tax=viral metagenome TaxID=1070528 RepID=A0A2V0RJW6_9ZZZZ
MPIAAPKQKDSSELSPDRLAQVLSQLSTAQWTTSTPVDQISTYKARAIRATRIQTFGPTSGSDQVLMTGRLTANSEGQPRILGTAVHRLSAEGKRLMKELPPIQITHRSRPAGLMSNRLQLNELNRRVDRAKENAELLRYISLPPSIAEEIVSIKKDACLKRLKLDKPTLTKYIKEHEKSSIIPGLKWGQLDPDDSSFWTEYFDTIKGYAEEKFFSGESYNDPFNFGSRQRADQQVEPGDTVYELDVTRTRIVMFTPAMSSLFAFMPDKAGFYDEVLSGAMNVMKINDHFITPMNHGGEVYGAASEALRNNEDVIICLGDDINIFRDGTQLAYDGVNWETQVGTILGEPFHGTKTYFGGMYHVPSGVFDTSLDDTLASMWVYSQHRDMMRDGVEIPGIMERETMDESTNFMLGMAYAYDPERPRLQGLKLTMDKSDAAVPLPTGRHLELVSKKPEDEKERWYLGYHGTTPTGGTLLDFLMDIKPEDFRGGEVADLIERGTLELP